ncbi:MAG: hypothetical protein ACKPH7_01410 [Planktothrix sp.]|jgi:hypothetical protein|uniref:hypothetical protein n=1 Tax=Planktothrix sp. TaxID=3088171 RepID=UPI0038D4AA46
MQFNITLNTDDSRNGFLEINSYVNNEKHYFYVTGKNLWLFLMDLIISKAHGEYNVTPSELDRENWINQNSVFHFAYWTAFKNSETLFVEYSGSEIVGHWQLIQLKYKSELEQIQKELDDYVKCLKTYYYKEFLYNALTTLCPSLFD